MSNNNNKGFKMPVFGFKLFQVVVNEDGTGTNIADVEKQMNDFSEQLPDHHMIDKDFFYALMTDTDKRATPIIVMRYIKYDKSQYDKMKQQNKNMMNRYSGDSVSSSMAS